MKGSLNFLSPNYFFSIPCKILSALGNNSDLSRLPDAGFRLSLLPTTTHEMQYHQKKSGTIVFCAGRENRTPVLSLARIRHATKLYPLLLGRIHYNHLHVKYKDSTPGRTRSRIIEYFIRTSHSKILSVLDPSFQSPLAI